MADREKVIKALECCTGLGCHHGCEYLNNGCTELLKKDALALLKEQEHKDKMYHALEDDWKRLKELLKEQDEEIKHLRLALDIVKGSCKGIVVET